MRTTEEILEKALISTAKDFPNSVIADLMVYFDREIVLKLLTIFSGQLVRFPKVETVWKSYRNKIIKATLDIKNTRVTRDQLASFFGISALQVSGVYSYMRKKEEPQRIRTKTIKQAARRIYAANSATLLKELKEVLLVKK